MFLAGEDIIEKIIYCWSSVCPCSIGEKVTTSQVPLAHQLQERNILLLAGGSLSPHQADNSHLCLSQGCANHHAVKKAGQRVPQLQLCWFSLNESKNRVKKVQNNESESGRCWLGHSPGSWNTEMQMVEIMIFFKYKMSGSGHHMLPGWQCTQVLLYVWLYNQIFNCRDLVWSQQDISKVSGTPEASGVC